MGKRKALAFLSAAALMTSSACGGGGGGGESAPRATAHGAGESAPKASAGEAAAGGGSFGTASITGKVSFSGTAPAGTPLKMDADAFCSLQHPGGAIAQAWSVAELLRIASRVG